MEKPLYYLLNYKKTDKINNNVSVKFIEEVHQKKPEKPPYKDVTIEPVYKGDKTLIFMDKNQLLDMINLKHDTFNNEYKSLEYIPEKYHKEIIPHLSLLYKLQSISSYYHNILNFDKIAEEVMQEKIGSNYKELLKVFIQAEVNRYNTEIENQGLSPAL